MNNQIRYYDDEGREHIRQTAADAVRRALKLGIKYLVVFTSDGSGVKEAIKRLSNIEPAERPAIVSVTYSYGQIIKEKSNGEDKWVPATLRPEIKQELESAGVQVIQGGLPFESIHIPNFPDHRLKIIKETLELISGGLVLCVEAVLAACDAGAIPFGEDVIAFSADTAAVIRASTKRFLFAPWGLVVREIICKPRELNITKSKQDAT